MSCEPGQLITDARCLLNCVPAGLQSAAQTAMLTSINGGETDVNKLMQNAKEFIWRVPPQYHTALQIYLMLVILEGTNRSIDELLRSASCMRCIPKGYLPPIQTNEYCQWSEGGTGGCSNPIVLDWLQRMADNGVTLPSDATIRAVCDFCNDLDVSGLTDKMLVINPVIPDSLSAMRYPLIWQPANGLSPFINSGLVAADLDNTGLQGHGSPQAVVWMDTGFVPSTQWGIDTSSAGLTVYKSGPSNTVGVAAEVDIGASVSAPLSLLYLSSYVLFTGRTETACWDGPSTTTVAHAEQSSFFSVNRISNTDLRIFQASSAVPFGQLGVTNAANQVGNPVTGIREYFMSQNSDGVAGGSTGSKISFMAIHEGLTRPEAEDFFNAIQTLRIALGGGWA